MDETKKYSKDYMKNNAYFPTNLLKTITSSSNIPSNISSNIYHNDNNYVKNNAYFSTDSLKTITSSSNIYRNDNNYMKNKKYFYNNYLNKQIIKIAEQKIPYFKTTKQKIIIKDTEIIALDKEGNQIELMHAKKENIYIKTLIILDSTEHYIFINQNHYSKNKYDATKNINIEITEKIKNKIIKKGYKNL